MDIAKLRKTFAKRLRRLRDERGLTQGQFADSVGISRGAMSYYEQEARTPDIGVLKAICEKCGVSADYMIGLMPDRNHVISDICLETGLYPKAAKRLRILRKLKDISLKSALTAVDAFPDEEPKEVLNLLAHTATTPMVNLLLMTDEGLNMLTMLSAIIFGAELDIETAGGKKAARPRLRLMSNHRNLEIDVLLDNISAALWVNIQEDAAKLRDRIAASDEEPE